MALHDWLATQGSWSHPCTYSSPSDSTSTESNAALSSFWSFFVLAAPVSDEVDGSKVVVLLQEAADIVENLREKLASNTSSLVEQEYWRVSVALVYLEQCGYDADQCSDDTSLRETFNELEDKLLTTLCKMRDVLDALKGHIPEVTRDVMPLEIRDVPEDNGQRAIRDLVIAGDVREMLQAAEVTFKNL
nr:hypothetical protein BaRGS_029197 [Batillaria attramentaria]